MTDFFPSPGGLYLHLPFCRRRCTYCAFAISTDRGREEAYQAALLHEIAERADGSPADTIFYGGGTPSLGSDTMLRSLNRAVRAGFAIADGAEISLEANPEDISNDAAISWRSIGVNRLSIGVQSFIDAELYPLGRGHGRAAARSALRIALENFERVSVDLILGLPGQTLLSFEESLGIALDAGVGHVSLYILDLEPDSTLERHVASGRTTLPADEATAEMYLRAIELCASAGLIQYEISNFARRGETCRHNLKYWNRQPYYGFGLGAHSFAGGRRYANSRDLEEYILWHGQAVSFQEELTAVEEREEKIFLALRQVHGLGYAELLELCGTEGSRWMERGIGEGWLERRGERVGFTSSGFLLSNEYISQLF